MSKNSVPNKKEGKLFSLFSQPGSRNNAGLTKEKAAFNGKYDFANFFVFLKRHFGDVTVLNLLFFLLNFSLILVLFATSGNLDRAVPAPASSLYQQLYGALRYDANGYEASALLNVFGATTTLSVWTIWTKILYYSSFTLVITFGLSNIGMAYVTRGIVRRDYVSVWHDFWYAIKRDWKQGLIIGIADVGIIYLLYNAILFYYYNRTTYLMSVCFYFSIFFAFFYFIARMYLYLMLINFNLKLKKLIKNAAIFTILGFKRNFCALIFIAITVFISVYLALLFPMAGALVVFIFTVAFIYLIGTYCCYPVIYKYMIKPVEDENKKNKKDDEGEEPVFVDRG